MHKELEEAYKLHATGKIQAALHLYKKFEARNSNNAEAVQLIGAAYLQLNDLLNAEKYLKKSEQLTPASPHVKNNLALLHKKLGNVNVAIKYAKQALSIQNNFYDANFNLAAIYQENKRYEEAIKYYRKAGLITKNNAVINNNIGSCHVELGQINEALAEFELAINKDPKYAAALNNKANILRKTHPEEALALYENALEIEIKFEYLDNYLSTLINNNKIREAKATIDKFLEIIPSNKAEFEVKLGLIDYKNKNEDTALKHYFRALEIDSKVKGANKNIGLIYLESKKYIEALNYFELESLVTDDIADNKFDIANAHTGLKNFDKALDLYKECIELRPQQIEFRNNLGSLLFMLERFDEAITLMNEAIKVDSEYVMAYINLAQCYERKSDYLNAAATYKKALFKWPDNAELKAKLFLDLRYMCDWTEFDSLLSDVKSDFSSDSFVMAPFASLSYFDDPELVLKATSSWTKGRFKVEEIPGEFDFRNEKIRVAYFSPDFRSHPVSYLISSLFAIHDRSKFEIFAFGYGPETGDDFHQKVVRGVDKYIDINQLTDYQAAMLGRNLQIDIAIDLAGYTQNCRTEIFRFRVAPIQASYLGFLGSMALEQYDYLIADQTLITEDTRKHYPEKIMYLSHYQCNDDQRVVDQHITSRAEFNLPLDSFVFCCFNNSYKITPQIFSVWMELLREVSGSVLFLYAENEWLPENLRKEAMSAGVDPDRLIFSPKIGIAKYLARFKLADLFLDTSPYNAGTTCSDALWAELPVLTFKGKSFSARMASSILKAIELPELIAEDLVQYKSIALKLASDKDYYSDLKNKLVANKKSTNMFNIKSYCRNLEHVYKEAHRLRVEGKGTADIMPFDDQTPPKQDEVQKIGEQLQRSDDEFRTVTIAYETSLKQDEFSLADKNLRHFNLLSTSLDVVKNELVKKNENSIDRLIIKMVLQKLNDKERDSLLEIAFRAINSRGYVLLTVPDFTSISSVINSDGYLSLSNSVLKSISNILTGIQNLPLENELPNFVFYNSEKLKSVISRFCKGTFATVVIPEKFTICVFATRDTTSKEHLTQIINQALITKEFE